MGSWRSPSQQWSWTYHNHTDSAKAWWISEHHWPLQKELCVKWCISSQMLCASTTVHFYCQGCDMLEWLQFAFHFSSAFWAPHITQQPAWRYFFLNNDNLIMSSGNYFQDFLRVNLGSSPSARRCPSHRLPCATPLCPHQGWFLPVLEPRLFAPSCLACLFSHLDPHYSITPLGKPSPYPYVKLRSPVV